MRAAIYEKGLAAGVGIKSTNAQLLTQFLDDPDRYQLFSGLLRKQIVEELANQGVVFGIDGCFEYALNPSGLPLKTLEWEEQERVSRQMRQVKTDEVLVRYQPPERGMAGQTVRGEAIAAGDPSRDVALADIVGTNTRVDGHRYSPKKRGLPRSAGWHGACSAGAISGSGQCNNGRFTGCWYWRFSRMGARWSRRRCGFIDAWGCAD
ncbi:MAG: flagellar assembly protein A [Candidatus Latescibacterota bacterium]